MRVIFAAMMFVVGLSACALSDDVATEDPAAEVAEPATVCHATTDCYWYAPGDEAKQNQVCDQACGAPATCQRTATGGRCVQLTGEAAAPNDVAVQEHVDVPQQLKLVGDGGAKTNTTCPLYATTDCSAWLVGADERNRLCTAGCGGPAKCIETMSWTYICGVITGDGGCYETIDGPRVTAPTAGQCSILYGGHGCVAGYIYDYVGRCQRSLGEP